MELTIIRQSVSNISVIFIGSPDSFGSIILVVAPGSVTSMLSFLLKSKYVKNIEISAVPAFNEGSR